MLDQMSDEPFVRIEPGACLNCGAKLSGAGIVGGDAPPPNDGDIAVCIYCSHIHVFDGGKMRNPTDAEIVDMAGDPELLKVIKLGRLYDEMFPK
jgi:hypothetical protein